VQLAPPSLAVRPAIGAGTGRYVLSWGSSPGATGYQVRWVVGHVGGIPRPYPTSVHSHTTAPAPPRGHLAFEVRATKPAASSPWNRVTVRAA
jgi:hypothetical protein